MSIEQDLRIEIDRLNIRLLQLNDEIESYCEIKNDLQERIDKAIEYIKKEAVHYGYDDYEIFFSESELEDLLEILEGDDSNE